MDAILARLAALEARADMALRAQVAAACTALRAAHEAREGDGYSYLVHQARDGQCVVECFGYDALADDFLAGLADYGLGGKVDELAGQFWLYVRYLGE